MDAEPRDVTEWALQRVGRGGRMRAVLCGVSQGREIRTSALSHIAGEILTTASGSTYRLVGKPMPSFAPFLEGNVYPSAPLARLSPGFAFDLVRRA